MANTSSTPPVNGPASRAQLLLAPDGTIICSGDDWTSLTGYPRSEAIGSMVSMIYEAGTSEGTRRQILARMAEGADFKVRVPCTKKDDKAFVGDFTFVVAKSLKTGESSFLCTVVASCGASPPGTDSGASLEIPPQSDPTAASANLSCVYDEAVLETAMAQVSGRERQTTSLAARTSPLAAVTDQHPPSPCHLASCERRPSSSRALRTR